MTLSWALEHSIRNETFSGGLSGGYNQLRRYAPHYEYNTVFPKFLEVVIPLNGECFIPVLGIEKTIRTIQDWFDYSGEPASSMKLSYPLYVGGYETKKTADSIIQTINKCPARLRLSNIITSKGLNYYGGSGVILDEKWNPLMLCGYIIDIDRLNRTIKVIRPVCYMSPAVFENKDILSKALIKKVIPYLSADGINVPDSLRNARYVLLNSRDFGSVPVTICYLNRYFVTPCIHFGNIETLDEDIWDFLNDNVADLI